MPVTDYNGVVINKLTFEQYKTLKTNNQLVASQTYVITGIDEVIDELENSKYWQFRVGRVINVDNEYVFHNTSFKDFSNIPVNTTLATINAQDGGEYHYRLIQQQGTYKFAFTNSNNTYVETLASGNDISNLTWAVSNDKFNSNGFGLYAEVTYVNESYLDELDSLLRLNNTAF